MLSSIYDFFESEYYQLILIKFIFFIVGIVVFFSSNACFIPVSAIITFIICIIFVYYYFFRIIRDDILLTFICDIILFFLAGWLLCYVHLLLNKTHILNDKFEDHFVAQINDIKYKNSNTYLVLSNVMSLHHDIKLTKVQVVCRGENKNLEEGFIIRVQMRLYPLQDEILPDGYSSGFYHIMSGISATGHFIGKYKIIHSVHNKSIITYINKLRHNMHHKLVSLIGATQGNFASAILLGKIENLNKNILENMRMSGLSHILCVSGLHLSIVTSIFFFLSRILLNFFDVISFNCNVKKISALVAMLAAAFYLLITGASTATCRAFCMVVIFMYSIICDRILCPTRTIVSAAAVILLFKPHYVFHPSFQLSFVSVLCLITGYEISSKYCSFDYKIQNGILSMLTRYLLTNIYSTFLAGIFTLPYIVFHFYKFANYTILSNLVAVPIVSFCTLPLGIIALILMPLNLEGIFIKLMSYSIQILIDVSQMIANLSHSVSNLSHIDSRFHAIFTISLCWLAFLRGKKRFLSMIGFLLYIIFVCNTEKPVLIYDATNKILSIKNFDNKNYRLITHNDNKAFTLNIWKAWHGEEIDVMYDNEFFNQNHIYHVLDRKIALSYDKCQEADFDFIISNKLSCSNSDILKGVYLLYCNDKQCYLKKNHTVLHKITTIKK